MNEKEIAELILSKQEEIFEEFADQFPGNFDDLNVYEKYKIEQQIKAMLILITSNFNFWLLKLRECRRPIIEIPSWTECKNNIKNCGHLNEKWEICGILDIDSLFEGEEAQEKCFEFVAKALKNTIKTHRIILL
jgi:hypothetical protein